MVVSLKQKFAIQNEVADEKGKRVLTQDPQNTGV